MIGLDTGFFVELLKANQEAVNTWKNILDEKNDAAVSCLILFELDRLGLKGKIGPEDKVEILLEAIRAVCKLVWIENLEILSLAARLSHGSGIPAVDALMLAGFSHAGCDLIYTTDRHLVNYQKNDVKVINLLKA